MINLRKTFGFLMVLMLAGFALPGNAAKNFSYSVTGTVPTTLDLVVNVFNATPIDGNSNFPSFKLTAPPQLLITGADLPVCAGVQTAGPRTVISPAPTANGVSVIGVQGIPPVSPQQGCTMTVHVKISPSFVGTTCGATTQSDVWGATVYSGGSLSGATYTNVGTPLNPTTPIVAGCMSFQTQPNNAVRNAVITDTPYNSPAGSPVKVALTPPPANGTSVTLASSCTTGALTLGSSNSATTVGGVATFSSLASSTGASGCTLTANATGYPSAASSPVFKVSTPALSFVTGPNNALQGAVITNTSFNQPPGSPVQAKLLLDSSPASGVTVTLSSSCSGLTGGTATTDSNGLATFSAKITTAAQGCTLSAAALGASAGPTGTFGIAAFTQQEVVACAAQIPLQYTNPPLSPGLGPNDPGYVLVTRGEWNAKGDPCVSVPFQFSNKVLVDDQSLTNKWDTSSQPSAAFLYQVNSRVKTGTPVFTPPKVAWEFDSAGTPVNKLDALKCLTPDFPKPYGRLNSQLAAGVTTYTLDRSNPQPVNGWKALPAAAGVTFPLYLDGERIDAKVNNGLTLDLLRGRAGTADVTHNPREGNPNDAADDNHFLSTPLPIDTRSTSPYYTKAVHMCWSVYGLQAYDAGNGVDSYFQVTDLFDFGDGFGAWE